MREGWRGAIVVASACLLFVAMAGVGTRAAPYAPNDWAFSHVVLADRALATGHLPLNERVATENRFAQTSDAFQRDTGLPILTFYATTVWHFWNGLPLHPALLATLAALTGLAPEDAARVPVAGVVIVMLVAASAALLAGSRRGLDPRAAALAPFLVACGCAPFLLDMRVLMPSATLALVALLLHALLRRALLADRAALAFGLAPLALLPFWYYTVAYFVILLFLSFALAYLLLKRERAALIPVWACLLVPLVLVASLLLNGALTSHLELARQTTGSWLEPDSGSDYRTHLNREPWRSVLLYAQSAALFLPMAWLGLRFAASWLRKRSVAAPQAVFATWALGGLLFSAMLDGAVGVSFLNRSIIYLAPAAAVVVAMAFAARWSDARVRAAALAALALAGAASAGLVATAMPQYAPGDPPAYGWMAQHVDRADIVYSSLEASSVLFRDDGFAGVIAFHPREDLLNKFWYANDTESMVRYLPSFNEFVLRKEVATQGFEEFGPARLPISPDAYAKFGASRDLHRVYDDGDVQVYRVALEPSRLKTLD